MSSITEAAVAAAMDAITPEDLLVAEAAVELLAEDGFPVDWTTAQIREAMVAEGRIEEADLSTKGREKMAGEETAMPDGSYPIPNVEYLKKAISAFGRAVAAGKGAAVKAWIIKRAKALKQTALIPSKWAVQEAGRSAVESRVLAVVEAPDEQDATVMRAIDAAIAAQEADPDKDAADRRVLKLLREAKAAQAGDTDVSEAETDADVDTSGKVFCPKDRAMVTPDSKGKCPKCGYNLSKVIAAKKGMSK